MTFTFSPAAKLGLSDILCILIRIQRQTGNLADDAFWLPTLSGCSSLSHLFLITSLGGRKGRTVIPVTFQGSAHIEHMGANLGWETPVCPDQTRLYRRFSLNATQVAGRALASCYPVYNTGKRWTSAVSQCQSHLFWFLSPVSPATHLLTESLKRAHSPFNYHHLPSWTTCHS